MRRASGIAISALLGCLGAPLPVGAVQAAPVTSEFTSLPARYSFRETVRVTNPSRRPALNVVARVILLPPPTPYSRVRLIGLSTHPAETQLDRSGNTIGVFRFAELGAHQTKILVLHYVDVSRAIAYHFPRHIAPYQVHSALYRLFTNRSYEYHQGVNTDAPSVMAVVRKVTRGLNNPVARAKALFTWEVNHIRYSHGFNASGGAVATLKRGRGICSDFAELYAALLRTDGIPARLVGGYVVNNGGSQAGFHEWDEFFVPAIGWVVADPTWGRFGYFARLQDNWHVSLYGGIVPEVAVSYYVSRFERTGLSASTSYQFVSEQHSLSSLPAMKPLPVLRVEAPSTTTHTARTAGWWDRIHHWLSAVARVVSRGLSAL